MELIDEFLAFLAAAYGKQPDKLQTLEKQAIAVIAAAASSRFAPRISRGVLINALTRSAGLYAARHPLATVAAFWFASSRNAAIRPQWAGPYTQEVEFAFGVPLFANAGRIFPAVGRALAPIFSQSVVSGVRNISNDLSQMRAPRLLRLLFDNPVARRVGTTIANRYPQILNNPATRGFFGYLSRHPAAALGAYYTGGYIDATYRPQFFGTYTRELITAGLFPAFANAPQAIPPVIRGAGNVAFYGSRGLASVTEWFVRRPAPTSTVTAGPLLDRVAFSLSSWLAPYQQDLFLGKYGKWVGVRRTQLLEVARGLLASGEGMTASQAFSRASLLLAQSETEATSVTGRIGYQIWLARNYPKIFVRNVLNFQFLPSWPRFAQAATRISWAMVPVKFFLSPLALAYGAPAWLQWPIQTGAAIGWAGYLTPILNKGTLAGYGQYWAHEWRAISSSFRSVLLGARGGLASAGSFLRLPQAASLFRGAAAAPPVGSILARIGYRGAGPTVGTFLRAAGSRVSLVASIPAEIANLEAYVQEWNLSRDEIIDAVMGRLSSMSQSEEQGYEFGRRVSVIRQQIWLGSQQPRPFNEIAYWTRQLQFVTIADEVARQELQTRQTTNALEIIAATADLSLAAIGQIAENAGHVADRVQSAGFAISAAQRTRRPPQRRAPNGRFFREQVPYIPPLPPISISFDQALAYINRRAAEASRIMLQGATVGVSVQPVMPGGILGDAPPGKGREFWLYRGRDRRLILQSLRDMQAIVFRDQLAEDKKKTTKLSNRLPIFDDATPGLQGAVIQVIRALKRAASLVRNRGPLGGYHDVNEGV